MNRGNDYDGLLVEKNFADLIVDGGFQNVAVDTILGAGEKHE